LLSTYIVSCLYSVEGLFSANAYIATWTVPE